MGEVGGEVALIADELSRAVELTLNPAVAHEARNQAYNACERYVRSRPFLLIICASIIFICVDYYFEGPDLNIFMCPNKVDCNHI